MKNESWYYASTTELDTIDALLAELAASDALPASPAPTGVEGLEILDEAAWVFDDARIDHVPVEDKVALLRRTPCTLSVRASSHGPRPGSISTATVALSLLVARTFGMTTKSVGLSFDSACRSRAKH